MTTPPNPTGIRPTGSRLVVKLDPQFTHFDETTKLIEIPEQFRRAELRGTVVAVGPGRVNEYGVRDQMGIAPGEAVLFGCYNGHEIGTFDGAKYFLMEQWKRDYGDAAPDIYLVEVSE